MKYFNYFGRNVTKDARCTREIVSSIAISKYFHQQIDLKVRYKVLKCYIWSIVLHGAETWTLRRVNQKHLASLKCGANKDGEGQLD